MKRRRGGINTSREISLSPASTSYGVRSISKRLLLQAGQVALDLGVYWVSLHLLIYIWNTGSAGFFSERKLFFCGVMLVCFAFRALYDFKSWMFWDEMREVLKASATMLFILVLYMFSLKLQLSRMIVCSSVALFVPLCLTARYFFRRVAFASGLLRTPILIIGASKTGALYARKLKKHPFIGCEAVGFLDDDSSKIGHSIEGVPVLGAITDFVSIQKRLGVEDVVVAIPSASRDLLANILDAIEMRAKSVSYIPDMYMLTTFSASIRDVDGVPLISSSQGLLNPFNRFIKNVMDYVGALIALVIFAPVFAILAWKVKKDDAGRVFFKHKRIGKDLASFEMYKFRTMVPNAEAILEEMMKDDALREEFQVSFKFKNDPRITKTGVMLRKTSLDELPQLFNVLKGEMSLVGPRPIVKKEVELYYGEEIAKQIFHTKPGMTGFWQVSGRNDVLDYQQRIDLDLYYIRNWSPWLDFVIIMRTVQILINSRGAY